MGDRLEVRVYGGDDGEFVLFEDDFVTRGTVEDEQCTFIKFMWVESTKELMIEAREGSYAEMIKTRTFDITLVIKGNGVGVNVTANPTKSVVYDGSAVTVKLI